MRKIALTLACLICCSCHGLRRQLLSEHPNFLAELQKALAVAETERVRRPCTIADVTSFAGMLLALQPATAFIYSSEGPAGPITSGNGVPPLLRKPTSASSRLLASDRSKRMGHRCKVVRMSDGQVTQEDPFNSLVGALWDEKDVDQAREILEAGGVDLSARLNGKTALHYAALDGHTGLVRELISRGALIDVPDEQLGTEGMTPLIWAALNGHAETCKTLAELGANISIREKGGMTASQIAQAYDHDAVVAALNSFETTSQENASSITWLLAEFQELTVGQLYDLLELRQRVFVLEQDCLYPDLDKKDLNILHLLAYDDSKLVAYARMGDVGMSYDDALTIGRVVVTPEYRGRGLSYELVKRSIAAVRERYGEKPITIGAQAYLQKMYTKLGFVSVSPEYDEDGIPHIDMTLS